jgi:hypothetical protein
LCEDPVASAYQQDAPQMTSDVATELYGSFMTLPDLLGAGKFLYDARGASRATARGCPVMLFSGVKLPTTPPPWSTRRGQKFSQLAPWGPSNRWAKCCCPHDTPGGRAITRDEARLEGVNEDLCALVASSPRFRAPKTFSILICLGASDRLAPGLPKKQIKNFQSQVPKKLGLFRQVKTFKPGYPGR